MRVNHIQIHGPITLTPVGNRHFRMDKALDFTVYTTDQQIDAHIWKGFVTDFRSGGPFVDKFIDQFGETPKIQVSYLLHDLCYTKWLNKRHFKSRDWADDILRACLIYAGMSKVKANLVWGAVRVFGKSAYTDDDQYSLANATKFSLCCIPRPIKVEI